MTSKNSFGFRAASKKPRKTGNKQNGQVISTLPVLSLQLEAFRKLTV
jgi:hypothetical protein